MTFPAAVDGFTVGRLAFANASPRPQTLLLADDQDPASLVTLPPTGGRVRTMPLTLHVKPGANSVTVSQLSDPALTVKSLAVLPRPALPPRFLAADPSSELSGGAQRGSCATCPGGAKVGYIGSGQSGTDGVLTMHVHSDDAARHTLSIWYENGDVGRTFDLSVDGGAPQHVTAPSTFSWSTVGSVRVTARLSAGDNTLTFSNHAGAWAPDVSAVVLLPG
jgi:alpha-galactosidase